jgi:hypothetical protein
MSLKDDTAEVQGVLRAETDRAWKVEIVRVGEDDPVTLWFPKSLCDFEPPGTWTIPRWIGEKERLV